MWVIRRPETRMIPGIAAQSPNSSPALLNLSSIQTRREVAEQQLASGRARNLSWLPPTAPPRVDSTGNFLMETIIIKSKVQPNAHSQLPIPSCHPTEPLTRTTHFLQQTGGVCPHTHLLTVGSYKALEGERSWGNLVTTTLPIPGSHVQAPTCSTSQQKFGCASSCPAH